MDPAQDKRSGLDRRTGNDRRKSRERGNFDTPSIHRQGPERRENHEIRAGWVKVSRFSSVCLGVPA